MEVYPGHVAGSLCGKAMSSKASSTIGFERRFNPALLIENELEFVAESASTAAPKPPNMGRLVELNRGPFVGAPAEIDELPAAPDGAVVLDRSLIQGTAGGEDVLVKVATSGLVQRESVIESDNLLLPPDVDIAGTLARLPGGLEDPQARLIEACGQRVAEGALSSFVSTGRGGTPPTPGGFVSAVSPTARGGK